MLRALTGCRWESAVVALLFSIHPLHVESVAWVSERKDVLCGLFWILTIGAYARYVRKPRSFGPYVCCTLAFGAALLSKPMAVTLPFVLLLLDYWPLKRLADSEGRSRRGGNRLSSGTGWVILEKVPLFIMAGIVAMISFSVTKDAGALPSLENISLPDRMENALVSYMGQLIWPRDLAIFYPHPRGGLPLWQVISDSGLLVLITAGAVRIAVPVPYLLVGWFWYLGTLVPVIGIVQAGEQVMADRYTYLTQIGLYIALVWGMRDLSVRFPRLRNSIFAGTALISICLTVAAWHQAGIWRDSETVFRHALRVTRDNDTGHTFLAEVFIDEGRYEEAEAHCYEALRIEPNHSGAFFELDRVFEERGELDRSRDFYLKALDINRDYFEALVGLATVLQMQGSLSGAVRHFRRALELKPDDPILYYNLGNAFEERMEWAEAIIHYNQAVLLQPNDSEIHTNLAALLVKLDNLEEAEDHFRRALDLNPNDPVAHYNFGDLLARMQMPEQATIHYEAAIRLRPRFEEAHINRGVLFYRNGDLDQAAKYFERTLEINPDNPVARGNLETLKGKLKDSDG